MKLCFVLNANPESHGGTPAVVRNIRRYIKSDVFFGRGKGIFSFLYPSVTAIKILPGNYDIVNIHDTQGYVYSILPKFMRKKIVYTCHGLWELHFSIDPPKGFIQRIKAKTAITMQKAIIKKADHIIAVSNFIKGAIIKKYKIEESRITVIHNGVDTKKFYDMKKKRERKLAIWVGKDPVRKGLDKAIEYVRKNNMKLVVVGIKRPDEDCVQYMGDVPDETLRELYNTASVLLFFTKAEAHPLVPLEAMACGLDVIASKESNIEIVPPQKDGSYKISGKKALKIIKKYDWKNVAKKYMEVYKKVMKMK